MSNVLPGSKPVVVPNTKDLVFISQDGNPRNAELGKIGEVLLGDEDLGNSDSIKKNIKNNNEKTQENAASIEDIKKIIGKEDLGNEGSLKKNIVDVATQLNNLTNTTNIKTYVGLSQLGLEEDTTLIEIIKAMPIRSTVLWDYKTSPTATDKAPDNSGYGMMEIIKLSITRVLLNYYAKDECYYTATASVGSNDEHISIWRQATFVDSGWVNLTISEPYKVEGINPQFRKIGNRVNVVGRVVNVPIAGGKIFVFPAGYRPYKPRVINLATSIDNVVARCIVNEGGSVELAACSQITNNAMVYLNGIDFTID